MHVLLRQVRFAVDPFGKDGFTGANSYAGKPAVEGFGIYASLWVYLRSKLSPDTGFVVNVSEIDAKVRSHVIPFFQTQIQRQYAKREIPGLFEVYQWLEEGFELLAGQFEQKSLCRLELELNPYRKISVVREKRKMLTYTEQFEFAAMHKLWNARFDKKTNLATFGKCANPAGHGHNYILAVTVVPPHKKNNWLERFQAAVQREFLGLVDHKNLNLDVKAFHKINPTVENIAQLAWEKLKGKLNPCKLVEVTVWENNRTCCRFTED